MDLKVDLTQKFTIILLFLSSIIFLYNFYLFIAGIYEIGFFDGTLTLLTRNYASQGLIPYNDFDSTIPIFKSLQKENTNIKLLRNNHGDKEGVVNAILTGFKNAKGNVIVMMAVDLTDDPKTINIMYEKVPKGFDLIYPTRYSKGGKYLGPSTIKSALSKLAGISTSYILGIPTSDLTYSYNMYKKQILDEIDIKSKGGFEFAEELLIKAYDKGFKISEVPTV